VLVLLLPVAVQPLLGLQPLLKRKRRKKRKKRRRNRMKMYASPFSFA